MTHSLHRQGNKEDLKEDFVMLAQLARNINRDDPRTRENFIKIGFKGVKMDSIQVNLDI